MNEERDGKCLRKVVPRSIIYVFQITFVFLGPALKQYINFEILAVALHWTGKKAFICELLFISIVMVSFSFIFLCLSHHPLFRPEVIFCDEHGNAKSSSQPYMFGIERSCSMSNLEKKVTIVL